MAGSIDNESIRCSSCGGRVAVSVDRERVLCDHCGATTEVPPEIRRRVAAHAAIVADNHTHELRLRERAGFYRLMARTNPSLFGAIMLFACCVPGWIVAHGAGTTAVMGPIAWFVALLLTLSPLVVLVVAHLRWRARGRVTIEATRVAGRCGACGGPLVFVEGAGLLRCTHCASTVVASGSQLAQLERAASTRRVSAGEEAVSAARSSAGSLGGIDLWLERLSAGPLGLAPFFALTLLVAGLILFVPMVAAPARGVAEAAWICLACCVAAALLALVWGSVFALQRLIWTSILAAAGPRWQPRWLLVRDAVGSTPAAAATAIAGFGMLAVWMAAKGRQSTDEAAVIMFGLGLGVAFAMALVAAARLLGGLTRALARPRRRTQDRQVAARR